MEIFDGLKYVNLFTRLIGTFFVITISLIGALIVYVTVKFTLGFRIEDEEEEKDLGGNIAIHRVFANSNKATDWQLNLNFT